MANAVKTKLQKLSGEYSAKVKDIRELKAELRKPFVTDAEAKTINTEIRKLDSERLKINADLTKLTKLSKTAEEYLKLNNKLKDLEASINKAEARGEDTTSFKQQRNAATTRLSAISSDVEQGFPEIKVAKPAAATPAPTPAGPTGPAATPPVQAPATGATPPVTPGTTTPPTGFVQRTPTTGTGIKKPKPGEPTPTPAAKKVLSIDEIIDAVANEYGSIDTIFKTDKGLQDLLRKAIGKDGVPNTDDDLTVDQFTNELENTSWFKTNASAVRQRGFYKRQFDDLVKQGGNLEDLYKTTEYGRGLKLTQQVIADEIKKVGATLTPEEIELISRDIYDLGYENQKAIVSQRIRAKIAYKPGGIVGGEAGENLAELRKTAKANGLDLEKNFGSSIQGWLQNLAQGESVETFKQIIRSTAKLGLPEKVSALIDQGVDLDTIYSPYKRLMASVLEINPETISLDDQVLRSAIGPDKEMSLYDYQKMLRKDNRWQFTNQAKEEVSDTALRVLRDFGFQG
jgi:hypothetical protein